MKERILYCSFHSFLSVKKIFVCLHCYLKKCNVCFWLGEQVKSQGKPFSLEDNKKCFGWKWTNSTLLSGLCFLLCFSSTDVNFLVGMFSIVKKNLSCRSSSVSQRCHLVIYSSSATTNTELHGDIYSMDWDRHAVLKQFIQAFFFIKVTPFFLFSLIVLIKHSLNWATENVTQSIRIKMLCRQTFPKLLLWWELWRWSKSFKSEGRQKGRGAIEDDFFRNIY